MNNRGQCGRSCSLSHWDLVLLACSPRRASLESWKWHLTDPFQLGVPLTSLLQVDTLTWNLEGEKEQEVGAVWTEAVWFWGWQLCRQLLGSASPNCNRAPYYKFFNIPVLKSSSGSCSLKLHFIICSFKSHNDFVSSLLSCKNFRSLYIICNGFRYLQHKTLTDKVNLFGKSWKQNPYRLLKGHTFSVCLSSILTAGPRDVACTPFLFLAVINFPLFSVI